MITNRQKSNWYIDIFLFAGFLGAFFLDLTGVSLHQWIGVFVSLLALVHLAFHWDWVKAVTLRFSSRTSNQSRGFYLLDMSILLGFFLLVLNGLVISTWLELPLANYSGWKDFHIITAIVTMVFVVIKIGLHWRWIVRYARRPVLLPEPARVMNPPIQNIMHRRDFLKLMLVVGTASMLAVRSALSDGQAAQAASLLTANSSNLDSSGGDLGASPSASSSTTGIQTASTPVPAASASQTVSDSSCVARCDKHCAYPGHCHRYQDSNQNGYCDQGECI
jgi:hypothetical protein